MTLLRSLPRSARHLTRTYYQFLAGIFIVFALFLASEYPGFAISTPGKINMKLGYFNLAPVLSIHAEIVRFEALNVLAENRLEAIFAMDSSA